MSTTKKPGRKRKATSETQLANAASQLLSTKPSQKGATKLGPRSGADSLGPELVATSSTTKNSENVQMPNNGHLVDANKGEESREENAGKRLRPRTSKSSQAKNAKKSAEPESELLSHSARKNEIEANDASVTKKGSEKKKGKRGKAGSGRLRSRADRNLVKTESSKNCDQVRPRRAKGSFGGAEEDPQVEASADQQIVTATIFGAALAKESEEQKHIAVTNKKDASGGQRHQPVKKQTRTPTKGKKSGHGSPATPMGSKHGIGSPPVRRRPPRAAQVFKCDLSFCKDFVLPRIFLSFIFLIVLHLQCINRWQH